MAHEIDESTGRPAIAYVGETPWHGLGEELPEGQPIETWLKAARLEWELKRLPVQYLVDGRLRTMDDRFVLVRSDNQEALSVVSGDYQIVQPKEVLEFYRGLVASFGYTLETAGALDNGRKVWALAKTPICDKIDGAGRDTLAAYVLLATSCDKTLATTAAFTSVRVGCQNTLSFAMDDVKTGRRQHEKVPHNLKFDPEAVKERLGIMDQAWADFLVRVRRMSTFPFSQEIASGYFEHVLGRSSAKHLSSKAERERNTLLAIFESAPGQELSTAKNTLWGAVNAVTYYIDHVKSANGSDRLDSAWFGSGNALKERAWTRARELITGGTFA
jgi:phage/plasmid-like protein (TIGR03299 family)